MTLYPEGISVQVPVRIVSTANLREHWAVQRRRTTEHRDLTRMMCSALLYPVRWPGGYLVTITRERPPRGRQLDSDNLANGCKGVRDGVADALGIDDGDARIRWEYEDVPGKAWAVRVHVRRTRGDASKRTRT